MYDIIVIGAGPAGISAGVYAVSRGKKVLILEKNKVGGIVGNVSTVTHYAAIIPQETGASFAKRMEEQAVNAGVEIKYETVTSVKLAGDTKTVTTDAGEYSAPKLIIANGSTPRKLGIPGEAEFAGRGIGLNAPKHGALYKGKNIYVVGGADGAVKEALYLSQFAEKLTIIHFEPSLVCISEFKEKVAKTPNITTIPGARLIQVAGKDCVDELTIQYEEDGHTETISDPGCGVFVYAGIIPNTDLYKDQLELVNGCIPVNEKMETSIPGVYAAGDIRVKQVRQAITAANDGAVAAINAAM